MSPRQAERRQVREVIEKVSLQLKFRLIFPLFKIIDDDDNGAELVHDQQHGGSVGEDGDQLQDVMLGFMAGTVAGMMSSHQVSKELPLFLFLKANVLSFSPFFVCRLEMLKRKMLLR